MCRLDTGSIRRQDICERSPSESIWLNMEPGQGESESSNKDTKNILKRLYRNVIIGAVKDLGCGDQHESTAVRNWLYTESYSFCCDLSGWDESWISDLFRSINSLPSAVSKKITRQCVEMMKGLAGLDVKSVSKHGELAIDSHSGRAPSGISPS